MEGFVDLVDLDDIGEQSVLHAIEKRFQKNEIYSSLGTILIAMNPYRHIPDIYSTTLLEEMMKIDPRIDPNLIFRFERPHVWMIARNAYLQLKGMRISQAIVISGESGGKSRQLSSNGSSDVIALSGEDRDDEEVLAVLVLSRCETATSRCLAASIE